MNCLTISFERDERLNIDREARSADLDKFKLYELHDIARRYGITETKEHKISKPDLIDGIISYEKTFAKGKQTELLVNIDRQHKSYFIKTTNNLKSVERTSGDVKIYHVHNYFFLQELRLNNEIFYGRKIDGNIFEVKNGYKNYLPPYLLSLSNDMALCSKAVLFVESLHFYLKVKYLLNLFDGIDDVIYNICIVYLGRTLENISNIQLK